MNIFVGNMSFSITEEALRALFEEHGEVTSAKIVTDRETGRPRGFGFVEMPNDEEAKAAMSALDSKDIDGRALKVNEARPKTDRGGGGGGGGRGGPSRGGGGGSRNRW
ncbi:MAG: RNA-binding protein [Planctomycetota bacterium]